MTARQPGRTALSLCAGGITGAVYEIGALLALDHFFVDGFSCSQFDMFIGTSAGSLISTLVAAGVSPQRMARSVLSGNEEIMPMHRHNIFQMDPKELLAGVRDLMVILSRSLGRQVRSRSMSWNELVTDLEDALPSGIFTLDHYERWLEQMCRNQNVPTSFAGIHRELYITANDLDSGRRCVFGEQDHRDISIPKAICASSAIPVFFEPVRHKGRDYIDGAAGKIGHLDVVLKKGAELVVCINPRVPAEVTPGSELPSALLGARRIRDKGLLTINEQANRMSVRTKLHSGLRRYKLQFPRATILLIEPQVQDADMLMANPMNFQMRKRILRYGYDSAARLLLSRIDEFTEACARHRIRVSGDRLADRPWELMQ